MRLQGLNVFNDHFQLFSWWSSIRSTTYSLIWPVLNAAWIWRSSAGSCASTCMVAPAWPSVWEQELRKRWQNQPCGPPKSGNSFVGCSPWPRGTLSERVNASPIWDTRDIIAAATTALEYICKDGHWYTKAGVMLNDFTGSNVSQLQLFDDHPPRPNSAELMKFLDGIHHSGLGHV